MFRETQKNQNMTLFVSVLRGYIFRVFRKYPNSWKTQNMGFHLEVKSRILRFFGQNQRSGGTQEIEIWPFSVAVLRGLRILVFWNRRIRENSEYAISNRSGVPYFEFFWQKPKFAETQKIKIWPFPVAVLRGLHILSFRHIGIPENLRICDFRYKRNPTFWVFGQKPTCRQTQKPENGEGRFLPFYVVAA